MENIISSWEREIAKTFNYLRKKHSGKGSKSSEARIANNVIFSRMLVELTVLEVSLIRFLQQDPANESAYYMQLKESMRNAFEDSMTFIHPDIGVNDIHFKIDLEHRLSFTTLILNKNLEDMIRSGTVRTLKVANTPHEKRG